MNLSVQLIASKERSLKVTEVKHIHHWKKVIVSPKWFLFLCASIKCI